ncbi:MAG: OmpA family protein, partial [Fulvivirga sp.]|nr:OmpA family protein [Fulvivirga sp.]
QKLSERRANAVETFLLAQGVDASRLTSVGYGESQPVADNDSAYGRQQNRRVEVAIFANEKMKKMARNGEL